MTRKTLDLSSVPVIKHLSHLPVVVDPSHGVGNRKYVAAMARGTVAVGADAIMVEVHPEPNTVLSDGQRRMMCARRNLTKSLEVPADPVDQLFAVILEHCGRMQHQAVGSEG